MLTASAQTSESIPAGNGTLNYTLTTVNATTHCGPGFSQTINYTVYQYTDFSYTESGVSTPLSMDSSETFFPGSSAGCSPQPPSSTVFPAESLLTNGVPVFFNSSGRGLTSAWQGYLVDAAYKVISILYATPGNNSSDSFTNSQTNGTTTSVGSNFTASTTTNFNFGLSFFSGGLQYGSASSTGSTQSYSETVSDASSVANASAASGSNTISHDQDLFVVWLNPQIEMNATGAFSTTADYSMTTPYQNGTYGSGDIVEVTAKALTADANGATNVPINILKRQPDPGNNNIDDLPGLASICADQTQYANDCANGGQCGCVPSDFDGILANDPILNTTTADNPMSIDTSGESACTTPMATDKCRYVIVPVSKGSSIQQTTTLSGPDCAGCNSIINAYTQTDSTQSSLTMDESNTETVGITRKIGTPFGGFQSTSTFSFTDSESTGTTSGQANQLQYSLSSSTVGCYQEVLVFEDTVFHTFVTQQDPGNDSCP